MVTDDLLRDMFRAALRAADPAERVPPALPPPPPGRTLLVGAGKAAAAMARAVEDHWPVQSPLQGLVITRYGHGVPCERVEVVEAGHPLPDDAGNKAAAHVLELVRGLGSDDLLLCLLSGGGSALLAVPAGGITLEDKRAVTGALLKSGATISEINSVRKHLSAVKGGRLALAAAPARVITLAISDVPGDDPAVIASGPTVPDPTTFRDARAVLDRYRVVVPDHVSRLLAAAVDETPKPGDPRLADTDFHLVARPQQSLEAAAAVARAAGVTPLVLGDSVEGEARELARTQAEIALQVARMRQLVRPPAVVLSGGETTVTVRGNGRGGRNTEYLLALTIALQGAAGIAAIAADTDGIDGTEDNAGAIARADTLERARQLNLDPQAFLDDNNSYSFFDALGDLVVTGPTYTNVNDFRAILVLAP